MHPRRAVEVGISLPSDAEYWVPKPRDVDDEGYCLDFRNSWPLEEATRGDVERLISWERAAVGYAARTATDEVGFEEVARMLEAFDPDDLDDTAGLDSELTESGVALNGLDLGVAGLSYVLSHAKLFPVASCRSHFAGSWSEVPVVIFAGDQARVRRLLPLVEMSGCGIEPNTSRGRPLFSIFAASTMELMDLADSVFQDRAGFRALPKTTRTRGLSATSFKVSYPPRPTLF